MTLILRTKARKVSHRRF